MQKFNSINLGQNKYQDVQNLLLTGKKMNNLYDDAINSASLLNLKREKSDLETYGKNITTLMGELDTSDSTLALITDKIVRAKELAINAANQTNSETSIDAIKSELSEIMSTFNNLVNTQYNGIYIFSGTNTQNPAYTKLDDGSMLYNGTKAGNYKREIKIDNHLSVTVNVKGDDVFGEYDVANGVSTGLFGTLGTLINNLENDPNNADAIRESLDGFTDAINKVTNARSTLGMTYKILETKESQFSDLKIENADRMSSLEETDLTSAISNLISQQYALQASMQATVAMPSLLNYI